MPGRGPTDPAEAHFDKGLWGWDLSQWRKLPMLFGYSDRLAAVSQHTKSGAGNYQMTITTVPSGYVYVVQAITGNDVGTGVRQDFQLYADTAAYTIHTETMTGSGALIVHDNLNYVLKAGDSVQIAFISAQDGDVLIGRVWGYKMAVAE
jgi:hypothetical protein